MKILILGMDGYLGWTLTVHLAARGHNICGCDNFSRRMLVREMGSDSVIPISSIARIETLKKLYPSAKVDFHQGDISNYYFIENLIKEMKPDTVVHFAEQPSAAYSMQDVFTCINTHRNNLIGTLNILYAMKKVVPEAHLLKLGTMGEWGTPDIDIPEGFFEIEYRGRKDKLPFPKQPGSFYHATKCHDSINTQLACKLWKLKSTDVMQGIVFGVEISEMQEKEELLTRADMDEAFGTIINRFCAQAVIEHPITIYGKGHQQRGFLPLQDSMQCLTLAIENPPEKGEYRVFNQLEQVYDLTELALKVQKEARKVGLYVEIKNIENPRIEMEEHYYNPDHQHLLDLGYKPTKNIDREIGKLIRKLIYYKERIEQNKDVLIPNIHWDGTFHRCGYL